VNARDEQQPADIDLNVSEQAFEEMEQESAAEQAELMVNVRRSIPTTSTTKEEQATPKKDIYAKQKNPGVMKETREGAEEQSERRERSLSTSSYSSFCTGCRSYTADSETEPEPTTALGELHVEAYTPSLVEPRFALKYPKKKATKTPATKSPVKVDEPSTSKNLESSSTPRSLVSPPIPRTAKMEWHQPRPLNIPLDSGRYGNQQEDPRPRTAVSRSDSGLGPQRFEQHRRFVRQKRRYEPVWRGRARGRSQATYHPRERQSSERQYTAGRHQRHERQERHERSSRETLREELDRACRKVYEDFIRKDRRH